MDALLVFGMGICSVFETISKTDTKRSFRNCGLGIISGMQYRMGPSGRPPYSRVSLVAALGLGLRWEISFVPRVYYTTRER